MNMTVLIDMTIKLMGIIAIVIALFELVETRKRRMVDMYWKISDMYMSEELQKARTALYQILEEMPSLTEYFEQRRIDEQAKQKFIEEYQHRFHDAEPNMKQKQIDSQARKLIKFLNQIGVLVRKNLIDQDLLFGLIGGGLETEFPLISILLESHRKAHNLPHMYQAVDLLFKRYLKWKKCLEEA